MHDGCANQSQVLKELTERKTNHRFLDGLSRTALHISRAAQPVPNDEGVGHVVGELGREPQ